MRRTYAAVAALLLLCAARHAMAACTPSDTALCLSAGRFETSVAWRDATGRTGVGTAIPITADTGYFWFFSATNIELVVKVLDARGLNGKFWVFFGALSNVEYTLTVRDTATGAVKQYHNPAGQFASVGDTGAFDPGGAVGTVVERAAGTFKKPESFDALRSLADNAVPKAAPAFTPCPSSPSNLWLNGCRFRLQVDWHANGQSGEGTGVQLTDDTGYFWFFSDTNVELMVKVLDARGINGDIWVFFGALSDVQYTLTVYDTVTNDVRTYTNPSGAFASVGDTKAFPGGRSVAAVKDASKAVSQEIDAAGGTLTTTGADGTVYTFVVPANAIFFPTAITMTPLDHIDGFPFSGGLKGGVQLEPEGLLLVKPGILTIAPTTPVPPESLAPFSYEGTGANFILYPQQLKVPGVQLAVSHFSGYGVGSATDGDVANVTVVIPSGPWAPYAERIFEVVRQYNTSHLTEDQATGQIVEILEEAYGQVVYPRLQAITSCEPDVIKAAVLLLYDYLRFAESYYTDKQYGLRKVAALAEIKRIILDCIETAFQKCVTQNDTGQVRLIATLSRFLQLEDLVDDAEYAEVFGKIERCLRFELDFDSSIELETSPVTFYQKVQATVPLRLTPSQSSFYLEGGGTTEFVVATLTPGELNDCNYLPSQLHDSQFEAIKLVPGGPERDAYDVRMLYNPGTPEENDREVCPIIGEQDSGFYALWSVIFQGLHEDESSVSGYVADGWTTIPSGNYVAKKLYERTLVFATEPATESTHFLLRHTPDAPTP